MKVYRIYYNRVSEAQLDIPVDRVLNIESYEKTLHVYGKGSGNETLLVLPTADLIAVAQMDVPDPVPAQADAAVEAELDRQRAAEAEAESGN